PIDTPLVVAGAPTLSDPRGVSSMPACRSRIRVGAPAAAGGGANGGAPLRIRGPPGQINRPLGGPIDPPPPTPLKPGLPIDSKRGREMGETIDRYSSGSAGRRLTRMVLTSGATRCSATAKSAAGPVNTFLSPATTHDRVPSMAINTSRTPRLSNAAAARP